MNQADIDAFIEALQAISEAKGAFNRDPLKHCENCLREMQEIAISVLRERGITPRGRPSP